MARIHAITAALTLAVLLVGAAAHAASLRFAHVFDGVTIPCDGVWHVGAEVAATGNVVRAYIDAETAYPAPLAQYPYTHAAISNENDAILAEVHTATIGDTADRSFGSDSVPVTVVYIGGVCYPPAILSNLYGNFYTRSTP